MNQYWNLTFLKFILHASLQFWNFFLSTWICKIYMFLWRCCFQTRPDSMQFIYSAANIQAHSFFKGFSTVLVLLTHACATQLYSSFILTVSSSISRASLWKFFFLPWEAILKIKVKNLRPINKSWMKLRQY